MNIDTITDFVKEHPKEFGIGVAGLVAGAFLFRKNAPDTEETNDTNDEPNYYNDAPKPPTNGYSSGSAGQYLPPAPVINKVIDYNTRGKVPQDIAKLYKCPNKEDWRRSWGRDQNANNVVCRNNVTGKDILPIEVYRNKRWQKYTSS